MRPNRSKLFALLWRSTPTDSAHAASAQTETDALAPMPMGAEDLEKR